MPLASPSSSMGSSETAAENRELHGMQPDVLLCTASVKILKIFFPAKNSQKVFPLSGWLQHSEEGGEGGVGGGRGSGGLLSTTHSYFPLLC